MKYDIDITINCKENHKELILVQKPTGHRRTLKEIGWHMIVMFATAANSIVAYGHYAAGKNISAVIHAAFAIFALATLLYLIYDRRRIMLIKFRQCNIIVNTQDTEDPEVSPEPNMPHNRDTVRIN